MLKEFREFIMKGNLIEIAVGLILALAFAGVVTAFTLNGTPIPYGAFLTALVNFLIVAWILFLIVKAYNRMRKPPEAAGPTELELLTEIRDELRSRRV
jgi:large conductance mechanosensitive channel